MEMGGEGGVKGEVFFFQAGSGKRGGQESRGLGKGYKGQG